MLWVIILALTLLGAAMHARAAGHRSAQRRTAEIFLVYILAGYYGVAMLLAAAVHLSNPAGIAGLKGWAPSEPFQTLYAFALLGMAASAFLSIWWRGTYLLGPVLSGSVLLLGGAYLHGSEILRTGRFVWLKDGPEVLLDLVVPLGVLSLAYVHKRSMRQGVEHANGADNADVEWRRRGNVGDATGVDVTAFYLRGARATLKSAVTNGVRLAVLKDGSPSCATTYIFDGTFRQQRDRGQGVTAALLSQAGIRLFNEHQLEEAAVYLEALEAAPPLGS